MTNLAAADGHDSFYDIELPVTVIVGQVTLSLAELSKWEADTVLALDSKADDPLELRVNGKVVATAELCEGETGPGSLAVRILEVSGTVEEE